MSIFFMDRFRKQPRRRRVLTLSEEKRSAYLDALHAQMRHMNYHPDRDPVVLQMKQKLRQIWK